MKKLVLAVILLITVFAANGPAFAGYPCPIHECSPQESELMCGYGYGNFSCYAVYLSDIDAGCDDNQGSGCYCNNAGETFYYGVGCICATDYYGPGSGSCQECPYGGRSDQSNNQSVTNCYKYNTSSYMPSAHGTGSGICFFNIGTDSYSDCTISSIASCDGGYYQASAVDKYCSPVGTSYYSVYPKSRTLCPTYTNPGGGASYGQTTGSGYYASDITVCGIPGTEVWTNSTGSYKYPGCFYSL